MSGFFFFIATVLFIRSMISSDPHVAVFVADLPAGHEITAEDVEVREVPTDLIPGTAVVVASEAIGRIAASSISAGEIVTTPRFIGNELLASFVPEDTGDLPGEELNMVPLKLADTAIIPLLHHGDTISVITHDPETGLPLTIATGGRVILAGDSSMADPSTLLIALPETTAGIVAAASLSSPLAVVLTGNRAG